MRSHLVHAALAATLAVGLAAVAAAQSPDVLYTWDYSFGAGAGPNTEGWAYNFGSNPVTVANSTDGVLTITEANAGGDWAVNDGYNNYKESAARSNLTGAFGIGGADLTGLDYLEFDISHNGTGTINGQVYLQPDPGTGCCAFLTQPFSLAPGGPQTIQVDLNTIGLSANDFHYVRAIGLQVFGNSEPAPVTFQLSEVRSAGTPLTSRVIADHTTGSLQNAVVKFDEAGINGASGTDNQTGLSNLGDGLRWVDLGGGPGGAVAWGNGNALAVNYSSRTLDISNYDFATVRMRAVRGNGADPTVDVQFFTQYADRAANNEFAYQGTDLTLVADGMFHDLVFPLSGFQGLDLVQWLGLNLQTHTGNFDIRVASVVLGTVPEPSSALLVAAAAAGAVARRRRR